MLKKIEHITIRDFSLFETSNDVKYLLVNKHIPRWTVSAKRLEALLIDIFSHLSEPVSTDKDLQREYHRMKSMYRIQMLIALHQAVVNLFNQIKVNRWKEEIGKKSTAVTNLKSYVDKIEFATGIKIKHPDDLQKLDKEIQKWVDKYHETFESDKPKNDDKLTFMQIVMGVFAAMNMNLSYEMYLTDFFILKSEAAKVAKQAKEKQR